MWSLDKAFPPTTRELRGFCIFSKTMIRRRMVHISYCLFRRMSQLVKANFRPKQVLLLQFWKNLKLGLNIIIVGGQRMYFRIWSLSALQTWDFWENPCKLFAFSISFKCWWRVLLWKTRTENWIPFFCNLGGGCQKNLQYECSEST